MSGSTASLPAHELTYRTIRDRILYGEMTPGQAVTIQGLAGELGISMTPVREAMRRLTAEGALEFLGNRRVCVPVMSCERFTELVLAREAIEPELARMAAQNMTEGDIDALKLVDLALDRAIATGDVHNYMFENHNFHFTLYGHARSQILQPLAETLWLRFGPLSRIICGRYGTGNLPDRHNDALAALRCGNHAEVGQAILADIRQGFTIVRRGFGWN